MVGRRGAEFSLTDLERTSAVSPPSAVLSALYLSSVCSFHHLLIHPAQGFPPSLSALVLPFPFIFVFPPSFLLSVSLNLEEEF